jgi:hypothetical protein
LMRLIKREENKAGVATAMPSRITSVSAYYASSPKHSAFWNKQRMISWMHWKFSFHTFELIQPFYDLCFLTWESHSLFGSAPFQPSFALSALYISEYI